MRSNHMSASPPASSHIERDVLYSLDDFLARMRWTKSAFRSARRSGLRVRYSGRRCYILGHDAIDYIDQHARDVR
jgi:hypothetical protein